MRENRDSDRTQYCNNFNYGDTTDCRRVDSSVPPPFRVPRLVAAARPVRSQPPPPRSIHLYIRVTRTSWSNWLSDLKGAAFKQVLLNKPLTRETTLENSPLSAGDPPPPPPDPPLSVDAADATRPRRGTFSFRCFVKFGKAKRRSPRTPETAVTRRFYLRIRGWVNAR